MKKRMNKKAQGVFGMPFKMIFSIFLIAVIIVVAFFAIKYAMGIFGCMNSASFIDGFDKQITDVWREDSASITDPPFTRNIPDGIEYVCFADMSQDFSGNSYELAIWEELSRNADYTANMFFYPWKKACTKSTYIEHIQLPDTNPYCFEVKDGEVKIKIEKDLGETLVRVFR